MNEANRGGAPKVQLQSQQEPRLRLRELHHMLRDDTSLIKNAPLRPASQTATAVDHWMNFYESSPVPTTSRQQKVSNRVIEFAASEGSVADKLRWTEDDVTAWRLSNKRRTILEEEVVRGSGDVLLDQGIAVNAADLAARVLGHESTLALQLLVDKQTEGLSEEVSI